MSKSVKVLSTIIIIVAVAMLVYVRPYISMEFADSAHYSEQDTREYNFYTPDILKQMPRISSHYDFDFTNITGPASHVYAIRYHGADDASKIAAYLNAIGYKKLASCHIEAVCWQGNDPQEIVTVSTLENPKVVLVSVIHNF